MINRNSCEVIAYTLQTSSPHISFSSLLFCYFSSYYRYYHLTCCCCCCYCYLRFKIPIVIRLDHHIQTMAHMVFSIFKKNSPRCVGLVSILLDSKLRNWFHWIQVACYDSWVYFSLVYLTRMWIRNDFPYLEMVPISLYHIENMRALDSYWNWNGKMMVIPTEH